MLAFEPDIDQVWARSNVGLQIIGSLEGDSPRVEYAGSVEGVIRPIFEWTISRSPAEATTSTVLGGPGVERFASANDADSRSHGSSNIRGA